MIGIDTIIRVLIAILIGMALSWIYDVTKDTHELECRVVRIETVMSVKGITVPQGKE